MKNKNYSKLLTPVLTLVSVLLMILSVALVTHAQPTNITGGAGTVTFGVQAVTLPNGNFIVTDPNYGEGGVLNIGAVFLYNGTTFALISKLRGVTFADSVGNAPIEVLTGGNYFVVRSDLWNSPSGTADVGAVTLCSATVGCNGTVSPANSLIGSTANDRVGDYGNTGLLITMLPNGNYIVRSPFWDNGATSNAGAVTFCNAATNSCANQIVSASNSLVGSTTQDSGGSTSINILANGNFLVNTPTWDNISAIDAGAITLCSGATGCSGAISASNSLVGTTTGASNGRVLTTLSNSNYVVSNQFWDGAANDVGAVTFCDGTIGCTGAVSAANSLVGSTLSDNIGNSITELRNGNYVVRSTFWDNGTAAMAGAVTFCSGTSGCPTGAVSALNSLVGSAVSQSVGAVVMALANGNYLVRSQGLYGIPANPGAVTLCNGTTGCTGAVTAANSLIGANAGSGGDATPMLALPNGNYVVNSRGWNNGTMTVGATTLCNGTTNNCAGAVVSAANSLTGARANDLTDSLLSALPNGNYVVRSVNFNTATVADVGAVTLCNAATNSCAGQTANAANSLVGSTANDKVGSLISIFPNGNYVVRSPLWNGAAADVGAITFCNAATDSCAGQTVSAANSLVGSTIADKVGESNVTTLLTNLPNGNLVIHSSDWDNTAANVNASAFTFCSAMAGCPVGILSSANSLTGTRAGDLNNLITGFTNLSVVALTNGNYLIQSPNWNNSTTLPNIGSRGAVTWCNGTTGCVGEVSAARSLIGSTPNDRVGFATALANGNYTVFVVDWDNPAILANAGFALYGDGANGTFDTPNAPANFDRTVIGTIANGVMASQVRYDAVNNQMLVGRGNSNLVTVLRLPAPPIIDTTPPVITPDVSGTLGNNDFYLSDVNISWTVSDAESAVSNQSGCDTQTVTSDTNGITFICMATSGGGTNTQSVTVKRDTTNPNISFGSRTPAANVNGWNNSDVTINWNCSDATSGAVNSGDSQPVNAEGQNQSAIGTCTDNAGNTASDTQSGINIDKTAPNISFVSRTSANANGWNNSNVTVNWSCSDAVSGATSANVNQIVSAEGLNQSSTGVCADNAGNSASDTQNGISIDKTSPVIGFVSRTPAANVNGWNNANVTVNWSCNDALSGAVSPTISQTISSEGAALSSTGTCADNADNTASNTQNGINIDKTAPVISFVSRTAANANGWNNSNVTVNWSCNDALSGAVSSTVSQTVSSESAALSSIGTCADNADNTASNTQNGIKIDKTAPTLAPIVSPNPVYLNGTATAAANASDALSGIASQSCAATDTATVGSKTAACTATDNAGNIANANANYQVVNNPVVYNFTGFFQPVDNLPMVNITSAGSAIAVKFSLNGNQGLNIMAAGYPASSPVACNSSEPSAIIEETVNAGNSSLTYDATADRYNYVWKTNKAWKGTCRILIVRLNDGSDHYAKFSFR